MNFEYSTGSNEYPFDFSEPLPVPASVPDLNIIRGAGQEPPYDYEQEVVPIVRTQDVPRHDTAAEWFVASTAELTEGETTPEEQGSSLALRYAETVPGKGYSELEQQQGIWDETAQALEVNPLAYEGCTGSVGGSAQHWLPRWAFNKTELDRSTTETITVEGRIDEAVLASGPAEAQELLAAIKLMDANADSGPLRKNVMKTALLGIDRPGRSNPVQVAELQRRIAEVMPRYVHEYCVTRTVHNMTDGSWLSSGRTVPSVFHPQTPDLQRPQTYGFRELERLLEDLRNPATFPGYADRNLAA